MRKIVLLIAVLVLAIMSGCGASNNTQKETAADSSANKEIEKEKPEKEEANLELVSAEEEKSSSGDGTNLLSSSDFSEYLEVKVMDTDVKVMDTEEYKKAMHPLIKEEKIISKTIKLEGAPDLDSLDILTLEDDIIGIEYNGETARISKVSFDSVEEGIEYANQLQKEFTREEAKQLLENFYKYIGKENYEEAYKLIGSPWSDEISYSEFASGYENTTKLSFLVDFIEQLTPKDMIVHVELTSTENKNGAVTKNTFDLEYEVEKQEGQLSIISGSGEKLSSYVVNNGKWDYEKWESANTDEKMIKVARTWEEHVYTDPTAAKSDEVLSDTVSYIDDNYSSFKESYSSIDELIIAVYDDPEIYSY